MNKMLNQSTLKHGHSGLEVQQISMHDDYPFPSAEELEHLHDIDNKYADAVFEYADKEQSARHQSIKDRYAVTKREQTRLLIVEWQKFILVLIFVGLCALFLLNGYDVAGTIFGGVAAIGLLRVIFSKTKSP